LLCYNWRFANFWLEIWSHNWRFFIDVSIDIFDVCLWFKYDTVVVLSSFYIKGYSYKIKIPGLIA